MHHSDREYKQQMSHMRASILQMAGLVEAMIADSVVALLDRDPELATQVIERDCRVDGLELKIDDLAKTVLVRWKPLASDLRFVVLSFKVVTDLERIGDLAVNISERALDLADARLTWRRDEIEEMAGLGCAMVRDAIDALLAEDVGKAQAVILRDDELDLAYARAFDAILSTMTVSTAEIRLGIHGLSVAKWLERIGDHATNLAEHVIFVLNGEDVRHTPREQLSSTSIKKIISS